MKMKREKKKVGAVGKMRTITYENKSDKQRKKLGFFLLLIYKQCGYKKMEI